MIDLGTIKAFLNVIHDGDDDKLLMLLAAAEDEALQYMGLAEFPGSEYESSESDIPASIVMGVALLVQAGYEAKPDEAEQLRRVAEIKLTPYRINMGV